MTTKDAKTLLRGQIRVLSLHIDMAKNGEIEEDCISCREKDLENLKDILEVVERESSLASLFKDLIHCSIISRKEDTDYDYLVGNPQYRYYLSMNDVELIKLVEKFKEGD